MTYQPLILFLLSTFFSSCATTWPEWQEEPHHFSVVFAGTAEEEETAATLGVDYEYRTTDVIGLGFVAEHAFEDVDATTFLAVVDIHLLPELAIQTGPGVEYVDSDERLVYRCGLVYEHELGEGYTLSPQVHYDITSGEDAVVFGFALGIAY